MTGNNNIKKLLTVAIPSYNSESYMAHAVESLIPAGDELEILIVDDGSTDGTAKIADEYEEKYPGIIRAIHQENQGHGGAVMTGIKNASAPYYKVVDSDDWVDTGALARVLDAIRGFVKNDRPVDLVVANFIYDKAGVKHKKVMKYGHALPEGRVIGWSEVGRFHKGHYMLMHSVIYRTGLLRNSRMGLPKHTFYVDNLFVYVPMLDVSTIYYINADLYHYFIGRSDQSVQEQTMIKRIDQQIRVNKLMLQQVDLDAVPNRRQQQYMFNYFEIVTVVSSIMLIRSGTEENLAKLNSLWDYIKTEKPTVYKRLRYGWSGIATHLPGKAGRMVTVAAYKLAQKLFGFN